MMRGRRKRPAVNVCTEADGRGVEHRTLRNALWWATWQWPLKAVEREGWKWEERWDRGKATGLPESRSLRSGLDGCSALGLDRLAGIQGADSEVTHDGDGDADDSSFHDDLLTK